MTTTKPAPSDPGQPGTSVRVSLAAAAKVLDGILRKPGKHGHTPKEVENKRRAIGQGTCTPSAALLMCLDNNGCLEEYVSALRTLMNPGQTSFAIIDCARHVTAIQREMGESVEDLLMGRADSHDLHVIRDRARTLSEEAAQLSDDAAHARFVAPLARTA